MRLGGGWQMPRAWTKERIDLLKKLWAAGKTAAEIAASLDGISRSAVLGKVFRLRLRPVDQVPKRATADSSPVWRRGGAARISRQRPRATVSAQGKSLLELTNDTCRWPVGHPGTKKFHFCGAGADLERGMPYCARHMRRAYPACVAETANQAPAASREPRMSSAPASAKAPASRSFAFNSSRRRLRF
jgi:GcrA cell cycle regulator